jgi:hypothetical protein
VKYYSSLLVQLKDIFKEKRCAQKGHQGGLVLARQCPNSLGTCNPEETGLPWLPVSCSPTLFSGSGLLPVPWTEKTIKVHHFSSNTEVIAVAETWLDEQLLNFFE